MPKYVLPELPYAYNALEPYIDARTMELHHSKHHQIYVDNVNAALAKHPELEEATLESLLGDFSTIPEGVRATVRNNGGGHYSHALYWTVMAPPEPEGKERMPGGIFAEAIEKHFGDFTRFKEQFTQNAKTLFGSGWTWLAVRDGTLELLSTQGHDTPLMHRMTPIFVIDVWEHAYYLKYQNRRPDYITAWWNVVNWKEVERGYNLAAGS